MWSSRQKELEQRRERERERERENTSSQEFNHLWQSMWQVTCKLTSRENFPYSPSEEYLCISKHLIRPWMRIFFFFFKSFTSPLSFFSVFSAQLCYLNITTFVQGQCSLVGIIAPATELRTWGILKEIGRCRFTEYQKKNVSTNEKLAGLNNRKEFCWLISQ